MGESLQQHHVHHFDPEQLSAVLDALRAATVPAPSPQPDPLMLSPELLAEAGIEPWTFHSPHDKCDVTVYVDDRNQVRHVPTSRRREVPAGWRRVLLA